MHSILLYKRTLVKRLRAIGSLAIVAAVLLFSTPSYAALATLHWNASADSTVVGYKVYYGTSSSSYSSNVNVGNIQSFVVTNLTANTAYFFAITAYNSAGTESAYSNQVLIDPVAPTVSISAPASGATVSGSSVTVSANAADNVAVASVQFKLDGANLGSAVTASPYHTTWNTTTATNAGHSLTAVATDTAGNTTTSAAISVTVNNAAAVNGTCGSSNGTTVSTAPSTNLCTAGSASSVSGSGPWSWSCTGSNGGTTASCSASKTVAVNGTCGSANGTTVSSAPSTNLCTAGSASSVSGSGPWSWSCTGSNGGTTASCSASLTSTPVNGTCGSANSVGVTSAPSSNLCSTGSASSVSGSGPWSWSCTGSNGGSNASCSASYSSGANPGTVGLASAGFAAMQSDGVATIIVNRTGGTSGAISVPFSTINGTALSGTNYTGVSGSLSWANGDSAPKTITVTLATTPGFKQTKTFTVMLGNPTGSAAVSTSQATVTIYGSITATSTASTFSLSSSSYSLLQSAGSVTIAVSRTGSTAGAATVQYATSNGTAVAGTNYTATSGILSWAATDNTDKTFTVPVSATAFSGTKTFNVTLSNAEPGSIQTNAAVVTITGVSAAPVITIGFNNATVGINTSSTLTWSVTNATSCTGSGSWSGSQATSGTRSVSSSTAGSYSYTLSCTGAGGSSSQTATLTVVGAPTVTLTANPTSISLGQSTSLSWTTTNATSCTGSGSWSGTLSPISYGSQSVTPSSTGSYTYTLSCSGLGGSNQASASLTVTAAATPVVTLTASPTSVSLGQSSTLSWTATNATSCTASGSWSGTISPVSSGSQSVTPSSTGNYTYTLTCTGMGGSSNTSASLAVTASALATKISAAQTTATHNAACTALASGANGNNGFYWEIGTASGIATDSGTGLVASGVVGSSYGRATSMPIESASRMIYADYAAEYVAVVQNNKVVIPSTYVPFLNETSGYNNMSFENCGATALVSTCATAVSSLVVAGNNSTQVPADIGKFYFNPGHAQVLENGKVVSIGDTASAKLSPTVMASDIMAAFAQKGVTMNLSYHSPALGTDIMTTPGDYAAFLQGVLRPSSPLNMQYMLYPTAADSYAVCTNTSNGLCASAAYTPIPANESWHYSIGHWIEDDINVGDGAFSSPGEYGFYPWIDSSKTYYGILARNNSTAPTAFQDSIACGRLIRKAFTTGTAQ